MISVGFQTLRAELDRWAGADKVATLWLRDDDAVKPTGALEHLLDVTAAHAVPVTLAVIPAHTGEALAQRLETAPLTEVAVHGWSHTNYAPPEEKKQELGAHRPREVVLKELAAGLVHLAALHGDRFVPVLVPPWNRIDAELIPAL